MRREIITWLLETHREMLIAHAEAENDYFQEYGVGDYSAKKMKFRADANQAFAVYQVWLARLATSYGSADEEIGIITRHPIPFPDEQSKEEEIQL
jgi:hypothetical protein